MKSSGLLATCLLLLPAAAHAQGTEATVSLGADGSSSGVSADGMASPSTSDAEKEWADRDRKMNEASSLTGGVGLVHMQHAQGAAPGQFRVGFTTEYFSAGFLCTNTFPCRDPGNAAGKLTSDTSSHIGGRLTLSMQITKWLEPYLGTSAYANSDSANHPELLQVLGDSVIGAKVHGKLGKIFHLGGALELWLINGTGSVGLSGAGTGAKFRGLGTIDLRGLDKPAPVRFSAAATYVLDNSGKVVEDTEATRGTAITRVERFGLNINRVDAFDLQFGAEAFIAQERVRPFLEFGIDVPTNRQGYKCHLDNVSSDLCLKNEQLAPSRLTLGGRFFPWKRGFNVLAALDIGVSGTRTFIEEVKPEAPWMLYIGAGWAFDTQDRPVFVREKIVEKMAGRPPGRKIQGLVHEQGKTDPVANAIVSWQNHPELTALATGADGRFLTQELADGTYTFAIRADAYRPGTCAATVTSTPAAPGAPPAPEEDIVLDCPIVALPRVGNIAGRVRDVDTQAAIPGVSVKLTDAAKKEVSATADGAGAFRFEQVNPGDARVTIDADGYLAQTEAVNVQPRKDNAVDVLLRKKPKNAQVSVGKTEIVIKSQIQFAVDSATILPESTGLLTEIADALIKAPRIRKVEVQGHTDNSGTPDHNTQLSNERAAAVVSWLSVHGVAADRLSAKGYGQSKPLAPNVTAANRAKNRRVQFIILDQDPPATATPVAKPKH